MWDCLLKKIPLAMDMESHWDPFPCISVDICGVDMVSLGPGYPHRGPIQNQRAPATRVAGPQRPGNTRAETYGDLIRVFTRDLGTLDSFS